MIRAIDLAANRVTIGIDHRMAGGKLLLVPSNRWALALIGAPDGPAVRQTAGGVQLRIVIGLVPEGAVQGGLGDALTLELRPAASSRYSVSIPVPPRPAAYQLPRVDGADVDRPLVVIDPGHGGHDPGSISTAGHREKDLALAIAKAIRDELLESGRARVALTREDDRYLIHRDRFEIARKLDAALFISVHCDSAHTPDATGASMYTLSEVASDKEAAQLAARENRAGLLSGVDLAAQDRAVSSILIDLTQRETMSASADFARLLGREAQGLIPLKPNHHRMASLLVLKAPDLPSILFEAGYISNEADVALLTSPEGRKRIAESVSRAVAIHFARRLTVR